MAATLDALNVLQQVELKLGALRSKVANKRRQVKLYETRVAKLQKDIEVKKQTIKTKQAAMAELELDIRSHDDEIAKLRQALNRSKTNKEYAAILTQINTDKADTSKLEDRVLEMMNELETLRSECEAVQRQLTGDQERLEQAQKEADAFERSVQSELESLEAERAAAAAEVPPEALNVFERVAGYHDGQALAMVVQPHPKRQEFICDGCKMTVTLEQFASIQKRDHIQLCHNCGRVLVPEARSAAH